MSTLSKMSIFLLILLSFSCSHSESADYADSSAYESETQAEYSHPAATASTTTESDDQQPATQPSIPDAPIQRKIIKTGRMQMQVEDVNKSAEKVEQLSDQFQGFVSKSQLSTSSYRKGNDYTIRVPSENFDPLLEALSAEAIFINNRTIEAQDVTQEYLDVEIRLQTKKDVRDRYIDILRNKAKTVKDVLLAEEQIRGIQEEIEAAEGRLKFLKDRTSLGTIYLEIYQEIEYKPSPNTLRDGFWQRVGRGFSNGWDGFVGFLVLLVNMWPLLLFIILFLLWKGKSIRRIFRRKPKA